MNCQDFRKHCVELLDVDADAPLQGELTSHLGSCSKCAEFHEELAQTLEALRPRHSVRASSDFKDRVMSRIVEMDERGFQETKATEGIRIRFWKPALVAASFVLILGIASLVRWIALDQGATSAVSGFSLLARALAAEETFFAGDKIVHIINEIIVKPASHPELSRRRWLPMMSLEATGKAAFHQLNLPAEPGESYTVSDEVWYDPTTGRFARVLTVGEKPIFANSYDGKAVYSLDVGSDNAMSIIERPVTRDFQPPTSPAAVLGIAAGFKSTLDTKDESRVSDAGDGTLEDGTQAHFFRVSSQPDGSGVTKDTYWLFKVRMVDNTLAEMEWIVGEESLLVIRRVRSETGVVPTVAWDLAGLKIQPDESQEAPKPGITPNLVVPNVSVQHMIDKADFETCIFATDPPWATHRQITDILDIPSPPHRMFAITYRAEDGRHVVLVQCHTYNKMLGFMAKMNKLVYASSTGFKVWSGPRDKWLAGILLQSASHAIKDPPSEDRTGYLLETPAGTCPILAINGQVTEEELHALIDSLIPASEYQGE